MRKKQKINERSGEVVCICEKDGNISMHDPNAWRRKQAMRRRKAEERSEKDDGN